MERGEFSDNILCSMLELGDSYVIEADAIFGLAQMMRMRMNTET